MRSSWQKQFAGHAASLAKFIAEQLAELLGAPLPPPPKKNRGTEEGPRKWPLQGLISSNRLEHFAKLNVPVG